MLGDHRDARAASAPPGTARLSGRAPRAASSCGEGHDLAAALDLVARRLHDAVQHAQVGASLPVSSTSRSSAARGGAAVDRRLGGPDAALQAVGAARRVDRRAGVEHREVARRTALAGEDAPRRVARWRPAGRRRRPRRPSAPGRRPRARPRSCAARRRRPRRRAWRRPCSARPGRPRWTRRAPCARRAARARPRSPRGTRGRRRRSPGASRPAGLVSGPRKLKIVRTASSLRTGTTKRVAPWCAGANMKPKPTSSMQRATASGARSIRTPSASSTSAEPDRPVAERLPCLATAQPAPAAISAAVVETLNVWRPPPVPAVSIRSSRPVVTGAAKRAHRRGEPDELVDRLALRAQRDQHRGGLGLGRVAGHDLREHRGHAGRSAGPRARRAGRSRQSGPGSASAAQAAAGSSPAGACRPASAPTRDGTGRRARAARGAARPSRRRRRSR